jgi:phage terminase small subunit
MDPITTAIMAALALGVTTVENKVFVDAYETLKNLIKKKFGMQSKLVQAVEDLEAKPDSSARKEMLKEEVATAKADQDPDLLNVAETLLKQISMQSGGEQHIQNAIGSYIAQAEQGSTANVNVTHSQEK